jgi:hypothetical protein
MAAKAKPKAKKLSTKQMKKTKGGAGIPNASMNQPSMAQPPMGKLPTRKV